MSEHPAAVRETGRIGNPVLILAFAQLLAGAIAAFSFLPNDEGTTLAILVLALFAVAGICASFAFAAGLVQFSGQASKNDVTKLICDGNTERARVSISPSSSAQTFTIGAGTTWGGGKTAICGTTGGPWWCSARDATGLIVGRPGLAGTPGVPGIAGVPGRPGLAGTPGRAGAWATEMPF